MRNILSLGVGIATGTKIGILAAVGGLVFVFVVLGKRRSPLTRYHLPALLLVGLAITGTVGSAVGYEQDRRAADRVDYSVEPCEQRSAGSPGATTSGADTQVTTVPEERMGLEFAELSPEAKEVFLQTLESNGSYSTRVRPDDIEYDTDTQAINYVRYDSACYAFVASDPMGFGAWILAHLFVGTGTALALAVGRWSLRKPHFRAPAAFLGGLASGVGAVWLVSLPSELAFHATLLFLAAALVGGVATLGGLRAIEAHRGERVRDRMWK